MVIAQRNIQISWKTSLHRLFSSVIMQKAAESRRNFHENFFFSLGPHWHMRKIFLIRVFKPFYDHYRIEKCQNFLENITSWTFLQSNYAKSWFLCEIATFKFSSPIRRHLQFSCGIFWNYSENSEKWRFLGKYWSNRSHLPLHRSQARKKSINTKDLAKKRSGKD